MTDLLPIVFARGQNESIDPRVAPNDVHKVAQNVRWRKDGRPAKRYGLTALTAANLDGGFNYTTQAVNAVATWNDTPLFVLGSGVRQFSGNAWSPPDAAANGEIAHFGPGEHDIVAHPEGYALTNPAVAYSAGVLVYLWDDGAAGLYRAIKRVDGSAVRPQEYVTVGSYPRGIGNTSGVTGFAFYLFKTGSTLFIAVLDTAAFTTTTVSVGTLFDANSHFDACGRGTDCVIVYESNVAGARALAVKLITLGSTPAVTQTQSITTGASARVEPGIVSDASSAVFVAWVAPTVGVSMQTYNNGLTAAIAGPTVVATDTSASSQPGLALSNSNNAQLFWSGFGSTPSLAYTRYVSIGSALPAVSPQIAWGLYLASKPFAGPAFTTFGTRDSMYAWVGTLNGTQGSWDDQRTFYLMQFNTAQSVVAYPPRRHMHTPGISASGGASGSRLGDVVATSAGYVAGLTSATRLGGKYDVDTTGFESYSVHSIFESQRYASRDTVLAGRVLQVSGGAVFEYTGSAEETGFVNAPVIVSAVVSTTGGLLSASSTYVYRAVYEYLDAQGRRHRSAPSDPVSITTTASATCSVALTVNPLVAQSRLNLAASGGTGGLALHIYRTLPAPDGSYRRVTHNTAPPNGAPNIFGFVNYTDGTSDTVAAGGEFIYTDGGVVPNELPPPCTFMTVCAGRVWLGGQLDRCVVTASKLLVDGEPTQFSDGAEFSAFLPQKCTGLSSLDGTVVAFARERIYLIQGDGPNDQGVGEFSAPVELPTDVGCIDWRSVVACSLGIFFQSKRGIYLLPRGFNTPVFIGAEVEDTLSNYPIIVSATLVATNNGYFGELNEITLRFVCNDADPATASVTLIYDLRTGGWSVDTPATGKTYGRSGTWSDAFVSPAVTPSAGTFAAIAAENATNWTENAHFIPTVLGTGDIRPFGVGGYGQFNKVLVMGEYRGNATVNAQVSVDGANPDTFTFSVTAADNPVGTDQVVYLDVSPKIQKGTSLQVTVSDAAIGGVPTEGFIAQALFIETELLGKTKRLPAGRKA